MRTFALLALLAGVLPGCGSRTSMQSYIPPHDGIQAQAVAVSQPGQRVEYACPYTYLTYVHHKRLVRKDPTERTLAALALGGLFDPESVPKLIEALRDPSAMVREAAHFSLRTLTAQNLPQDDYEGWRTWWKTARRNFPDETFVERRDAYMKALNADAPTIQSESQASSQGVTP